MRDGVHPVRRAFENAMRTVPIAPLLAEADTLLVGFSGGADSAALLVLTAEYCRERGRAVRAVHVHHGIRGAEAESDAAFCREFCAERGIPFEVRRVDAPALAAAEKIGLEEAARRLRYAAFDELTADARTLCATAHSADDNLETVLFHMMRGTGLDGLCGIPPVRGKFIRPLLHAGAADIRDFCRASSIPFVLDSTNADTAYTRNYIRNAIVPAMRRVTPAPEAAAARMIRLLRADAEYLNGETVRALGAHAGAAGAPLSVLAPMPEPILARACARLYANAGGGELCAVHLDAVCALARRGESGRISLPGRISARVFDGRLSFVHETDCRAAPPDFACPLDFGETRFDAFGFGVLLEAGAETNLSGVKNIYKLSTRETFPLATIEGKIILRFRRPGDTVRMGGMTRSVRKLLNAARIPPETRARLPVFCDGAGILWIPGVCKRDAEGGGERVSVTCFSV